MSRLARSVEKARHNDDAGFTLIELLIVIVILGVLAGIVVFSVQGVTDRGTSAACKTAVKNVQVASEAYYAKNGSYAADLNALMTANFLRAPLPPQATGDPAGYFINYNAHLVPGQVVGNLNGKSSDDCQ